MNLKQRMAPWNILLGVSIATMVAALAYDLMAPMPKIELKGEGIAKQERRLREQAISMYEEHKEDLRFLSSRLWTEDDKLIGPKAMARTNKIAQLCQLKISAFRPQKPVQEGTLVRYPFVISLEGTYPQVVKFIQSLESPNNRLVVHIVQIASSDGASSAVNAVVNIWALKEAKVEKVAPTTRRANA